MVLRWALLKAMGPDRWHYHGLLNEARFVAFREALRRAVSSRPDGCSVADLGAGHGFLAAAAETLGAKPVTRFERLVPLVKIQTAIARDNGLTFRVHPTLPGDDSDDDEEEEDAGVRAARAVDVAAIEVWEPTLLGGQQVGVLGNGLLQALTRARKCGLIGVRTQVIPRAVTLVAAAVHVPAQTELVRCPLEDISGFDLSKFSTFCPDNSEPCCLQHLQHNLLTAPAPVFSFELNPAGDIVLAESGSLSAPVSADGVCNAVVFWHEMQLDDHAVLKAEPCSNARQAIYFLPEEVRVTAGSTIKLIWERHDETQMRFRVEGGAVAIRHVPPGSHVVQRWHFGMLNDLERNEAFYRALKALVRPGAFVLDIGAGTGLLGMMAAR
jgi:predicted RNA methylase